MNDTDTMREIEAIKQLKARYCRLLDAKEWVAWRSVFTDDFVCNTTETGGKVVVGADAFIAFVRGLLGTRATVHQLHAPEIELTSETTARGIWAMEDVVRFAPGFSIRGYGHYHDTYEKSSGEWRMKSLRLTRLRLDAITPILSFGIPLRLMRRKT